MSYKIVSEKKNHYCSISHFIIPNHCVKVTINLFIVDLWSLSLSKWLVRPGRSGSLFFSGKFPNTAMLAMQIDFSIGQQ